ncbi:ribonuclease HI [Acrasis kona]|uniref:ribonuclease H n=1 Tax=Acrasis kona TaxID=1008807 RepID=A0AAW2YSW0_9EUKA
MFYAVQKGTTPGIYNTWDEAKLQVSGFKGAVFKKFKDEPSAKKFVEEGGFKPSTDSPTTLKRPHPTTTETNQPPKKSKASKVSTHLQEKLKEEAPSADTEYIPVYTDGSCLNNGSDNAVAGIGVWWGDDHPLNLSEPLPDYDGLPSNIRAELVAITRALDQYCSATFKKVNSTTGNKIGLVIWTDSKYSCNCLSKWIDNWMKKGWKTSTGSDVAHRDLIEPMYNIIKKHPIKLRYCAAHCGIYGNEQADILAGAWSSELNAIGGKFFDDE